MPGNYWRDIRSTEPAKKGSAPHTTHTYVKKVPDDSHGGDLAPAGRELVVNVDGLQGLGAGDELAAVQPGGHRVWLHLPLQGGQPLRQFARRKKDLAKNIFCKSQRK